MKVLPENCLNQTTNLVRQLELVFDEDFHLKLYQCNALLSTYIHQNNQKVEKKPKQIYQ